MKWFFLMAALVAGMMAPVQAGLNAKVGRALDDPFYAALISFFVGTLGLLAYALVMRTDFSGIRQGAGLHWSVWLAGLLGAFYVTSVIIVTPRLGAALTFGLVVAGQLLMAVAMDHYGILGVPVQAFSWPRFLGIILITAGVVLIRRF